MSGRRRALVVAIDRYVHPMLRKLAAPTADAAALATVLGEADLGGFEVEVLTDADSYQVTQAVEALLGDAESSDLVLLHFSCHGIKDDSGELFLAATNTVPNRLVSTAVEAAMVSRLIQRSRAQRVVLLLDCCYGGAFERGVVARAAGEVDVVAQFSQHSSPGAGRGRVVITASSAMEYAFEGTTLTDNTGPSPSLFTGALVEGITSGEADRDQDGQVGLDELYDYIHAKVQARTPNQTPSKWEFGVQGDLYIARNPRRKILPGRLPDDLLELIVHPTASVRLAAVGDLDQLAGGPNLRLACGARLALAELRDDDSRRVSAAATNALERTALRITPTSVDLGQVPIGSEPHVEVRVDGGPLALASSIDVTHEHLHARFQGSVLSISTTAAEPGPLDGQVRLTGPSGDATVEVTGAVIAGRQPATEVDIPHPRSKPAEEQTTETDHTPEVIEGDVDPVVEVPSTDGLEGVDQHVGEAESVATTEREAPPPGSQGTKRQGSRRVPVPVLVAAVVVLLLAATLIVVLVTRSSDRNPEGPAAGTTPGTSPSQPTTVPAPFESTALYEFARYLFNADECSPGGPENTPLIWKNPHTELVHCESADPPYAGAFWCTEDVPDLKVDRRVYLKQAVGGTQRRVTGTPAGKDEAVDGVQVAFVHIQNLGARVYWDSPAQLCAGELQAALGDNDVGAAIDYWHNGSSS
jgi:Caspase domain